MSKKSKRLSVGLGLFLVFALAAGGAYAYWTNSGSGTGTATTASGAAGQLTVTGTPITGLAPGVAAVPLAGTINNPSTTAFYATSITVSSITIDSGHAGCTAGDYTVTQPSISGGNIPAGGNLPFSSGSIAFNNSPTVNQDACKGATVTINYTVS